MSEDKNAVLDYDQQMAERSNIKVRSPEKAKKVIKFWLKTTDFTRHRAQHMALEGESGIGKTAIVRQVCADPDIDRHLIEFRVSNADEGQMNGYPMPGDGFINLSMVKQIKDKIQAGLDAGKKLVINFDELNRAKPAMVRTIFNIIDEKNWAGIQLPMDTAFMVCLNPPSEIHNVMDIFGQEAALNSRFRILGVKPDINDFLNHMDGNSEFHWIVREYVKNNPKKLLDYQAMYSGKKYFCPAVWENIGCMITQAESMGYAINKIRQYPDLMDNIYAAGGTAVGSELVSYMTDMHRHITPSVILEEYDKIRPTIKEGKSLSEKDDDLDLGHLTVIAGRVAEYLGAMKIDFTNEETQCENLAAFMSDLPDEPLMMFVRTLGTSLGEERATYMPKMTESLKQHDSYLQTADRILQAQRRGFDAFGKGA